MRKELPKNFIKTIKHFFPDIGKWFNVIKDKRDQKKIEYSKNTLLWEGASLYTFKIETRRSINYRFNTPEFILNFNLLSGENTKKISHHDTLNNFLKKTNWEESELAKYNMVNSLIRDRVLEKGRILEGYYAIAADGTGVITFKEKHCENCLTKKLSSGETLYYHNVLEYKFVTPFGLALSVATDFMETMPSSDKQDCELSAFKRSVSKVKSFFPQLKICLLGDALFAVKPVFDICHEYNWKFVLSFKEGRSPDVFSEYIALKNMETQNRLSVINEVKNQEYAWVNGVDYHGVKLNVVECVEHNKKENKTTRFVYITNFEVNKENCKEISDGGRLRQKIENQGFNAQKNEGYNLEHAFSTHPQASKNFYMLMQIAHIFNQLFEYGSLLRNFKKTYGSTANLTRELFEVFRNFLIDKEQLAYELARPFQIRLGDT